MCVVFCWLVFYLVICYSVILYKLVIDVINVIIMVLMISEISRIEIGLVSFFNWLDFEFRFLFSVLVVIRSIFVNWLDFILVEIRLSIIGLMCLIL